MPTVATRIEFTPPLHEIAACIHAEQSLTFVARERRRVRADLKVMFVFVPLHDVRNAALVGQTRGEWLVWQDHTREGVVARLPAGGAAVAAAITTADDCGRLASHAIDEVTHATWKVIAH